VLKISEGVIVAGFGTVGKTFLSKKYNNILDLESSSYKYDYSCYENVDYEKLKGVPERKRNKEWPYNYYIAMKEAQKNYDIVFVQLNIQHLEYFDNNNIEYYIVYPSLDSWEWVKQRSINRGNNEKWLAGAEQVFEEYYIASKNSKCKKMFMVNKHVSLEDVLKENKFI